MELHLIYTDSNIVLSKKKYGDWIQIQEDFPDYKTSLGPWSLDEMIDFLKDEYDNLLPSASAQVNELSNSSLITKELSYDLPPVS
ncbi:hypothetical protein [Paraglaciecola sp. L1A13]|uniref:hypothetical protein n=1 Tax=Paraglaciecola sp. L1A13 TaxID=2686359 RepID=UPI00131B7C68|nr:hypothetical protein [Paraglaciecola sp. L1A13]